MPLSRSLSRRPRVIMDLAGRGIRRVPRLGRYNHTRARAGLAEHAHRGAMEICYLVKGCQTYRLGDRSYRLTGGDVFVAFPNESHSTDGLPQEKGVLYWMAVDMADAREPLLGLPKELAQALERALLGLERRHFRGTVQMQAALDEITTLFHQPPDPLVGLAMANRIGAFLLEVVARAKSGARGPAPARALEAVREHIRAHLDEPLPVSRLAAVAGLSESRFKSRFKSEVGIPPAEYVLRERVQEAERRLQQGNTSVTSVAFELGFSSSQYFATVFKRFTGRSPSAVRAKRSSQVLPASQSDRTVGG